MDDREGVPVKVKVHDKRRGDPDGGSTPVARADEESREDAPAAEAASPAEGAPAPEETDAVVAEEAKQDYLDDLKRLQAEFANYRKRMMKEQASVGTRASARLVERLLPVLDNFERAIAHGEGGEGVRLLFKQLSDTLATEGLEEVAAEGVTFDPTLHEAVATEEDPHISEPVVRQVLRRGYLMGGQLLRPAMVIVARPAESADEAKGSPGGATEVEATEGVDG